MTATEFDNITINGIPFIKNEIDSHAMFLLQKQSEEWEINFANLLLSLRNSKDHIIVFTSGSSGKPRAIKILKQHLIYSATKTTLYFNITHTSTIICCLPTNYIAGIMMVVRAFVSGCNMVFVKPNANPIRNFIGNCDFIAMTMYQFQHSLPDLENNNSIKTILLGGGPIHESIQNAILQLSQTVYHSYGMTETCSHIALRNCKKENNFTLLQGITISRNAGGCLVIDAPHITQKTITTNDLVEIFDDETFSILGRVDTIINSGGIKIIPEVIEEKLSVYITEPFFISSVPDTYLGEKIIMVVETTESEQYLNNIKDITQKILEKFEIPKEYYFIPTFIYTPTKKIDKIQTFSQQYTQT